MALCDIERPATPPARSPRQNPTPQSPRQKRAQSPECTMESDSDIEWSAYSPRHIASLTEEDAKRSLKSAVRRIKSLELLSMQLEGQKSHYRFNLEMLRAEREESTKRLEVEHDIAASNQALLLHRLLSSYDDKDIVRQRHLKARKKVGELTEDTRRQQLSIEHLKRALLSSKTEYPTPPARPDTASHGECGLEVLSDAAGLAQMRDLDQSQSSTDSIHKVQAGSLMSPAAFPVSTGVHKRSLQEPNKKKRKTSQDVGVDQLDAKDQSAIAAGQIRHMSRRLTFNSSGQTVTPMTPMSPRPRRSKLEPSAMS